MEAKEICPSPWSPMENPVDKKVIGKLLEELGECTAAAARCLIQGIEEKVPETGEVNVVWLAKEMADVFATLDMAMERFSIDRKAVFARAVRKKAYLAAWLAQMPTDGSVK